jgi:antitoxin CptB
MSELPKLRWRCRRGMKELDVLLLNYLERHYALASESEQCIFKSLLELQDPQLYAYMIGREIPADAAVAHVVRKITAAVNA